MPSPSRHAPRREQLLLDWTASSQTPSVTGAGDPAPPVTTGESKTRQPPVLTNDVTVTKLSTGAAAIVHAHLPPPNVEQLVEASEISRESVSTFSGGEDRSGRSVGSQLPEEPRHDLETTPFDDPHPDLLQVLPWDF